ncbi:thioesterase family protein [Sabulilitoribacter arenilitoris]|uniref:Thioesterase family protein n=1 Tax=Wocania arenilitoris TaxID=2044858 RepID=A0AAE3JK76_9FLAO|nr:acyl-CoA thioesterase [Wocania arenilitoris]MCF7567818.1 thioesterase family protein [Wocania arenilitoris]
MRWIRLLLALIKAKFKSKVKATDVVKLSFNVWITDIDVSIMNHAAIMTIFEIGRLDFMVRTNFFKVANKNKWYFPTQAISVQYYRPLKVLQKAKLFTRISYVDEKWIYVEQKIVRNNKEVAACLVKNTIKKGRDTVPTLEIMKVLNVEKVPNKKYDLITLHELEASQMNTQLIKKWKV